MADQVLTATTTTSAPSGVTRIVETTPAPPPVKPGWQTTEFWERLAAVALTVMFASGILTGHDTALAIAGMAATILGSLGYTVGRSMVKSAASSAPLAAPPPLPLNSSTLP